MKSNNKLLKTWLGLSIEVRTSIAIMTASFFQSGMKLLFVPVFTRLMSPTEYGIVTVFESIQTTLGTITMLSLWTSVYNRGMQEFKTDRNCFTASLLFLGNLFTLTVGIVFLALHRYITPYFSLSGVLWLIMFANFLFLPAYNFWIARQKFEYQYRKMLIVTVLINIFSPIFAVCMILSPAQDKALARILGMEAVLMAAYIPLFLLHYKKSHWEVKKIYILYGLKFNLPLIPHYASQQILSSCDRIMISHIINEASAGIYGLSYQIAAVVHVIWSSINAVLVPWEYDKIEKGRLSAIRQLTRNLVAAYAAVCVGIMFVAPEAVRLFAPSSYYEGIYVMAPVVAGSFFSGLYSLFAILEFYYKKTVYVMVASSTAAILNIILNAFFIPLFGYRAAAYTTLACYCIYALMHAINLKRLKIAHYYDMKTIAGISAGVILISVIVVQTYDGFLLRYSLLSVLLCIAYIRRDVILQAIKTLRRKG